MSSTSERESKKRKSLGGTSATVGKEEEPGTLAAPVYETLLKTLKETEKKLNEQGKELAEAYNYIESLEKEVKTLKASSVEDDTEEQSDEDDPVLDTWTTKFLLLRAYRIREGHCRVPYSNATLGNWVNDQKRFYKNVKTGKKGGRISKERIDMLDAIGFSWGKSFPDPISWETGLAELTKCHAAMGNCNVPISQSNPSQIGKWVSAQRTEYRRLKKGKDSLLTLDQVAKLNEIGFNWKGPRLS